VIKHHSLSEPARAILTINEYKRLNQTQKPSNRKLEGLFYHGVYRSLLASLEVTGAKKLAQRHNFNNTPPYFCKSTNKNSLIQLITKLEPLIAH